MFSVGILSYRRPLALKRCLQSLAACTRHPFELHLVNQGYLDPALEEIYAGCGGRVTYLEENVGCARGRDLLLRGNSSEYLFLADDDLVFSPGWEAPLLEAMAERSRLAAVSPYLKEGWKLPFVGRFERRGTQLRARRYWPWQLRSRFCGSDFLPGGCVLLRAAALREVALDPGCTWDWEDVDLWLQLAGRGWELGVCPGSRVEHRRPPRWWHRWAREYDAIRYDPHKLAQSRAYFLRKWNLTRFR